MTLSLRFSPCPNDTFIFDAMIHGKVDTEGLAFDVTMLDVEELNRRALRKEPDITKLSFHAFMYAAKDYILLDSGSALGFGCGPVLISDFRFRISDFEVKKLTQPDLRSDMSVLNSAIIAIPGRYTTASLLLCIAFPDAKNKKEMLFSDIEDAILSGKADAGVIIHENRFTYETKGLKKIIDLGEYWENLTASPIPLGTIAVRRSLPDEIKQKINRVMKRSVEYAIANPASNKEFVKAHAQEMDEKVIEQHIGLYVNKFTVELGEEGKNAMNKLLEFALERKIIPEKVEEIFL